MNEKQQQLLFDKGITNVPSDILCSDNALEECEGLTYDNGEHKVIQKPVQFMSLSSGHTLLYVHRHNEIIRYITKNSSNVLCYTYNGSSHTTEITNPLSVDSIGNTLIVNTSNGVTYCLWSGNSYKVMGDLPNFRMEFKLLNFSDDFSYTEKYINLTELMDGKIVHKFGTLEVAGSAFKVGSYEDAKAALVGLVSMRINQLHENKRFVFPFWVRYAIRLFDGSYTHISNPILMLPTVRNNWEIFTCNDNGNFKPMTSECGGWPQTNYKPLFAELGIKIYTDGATPSDWEDIIGGIDIFVSEEQKTFDMEGAWTIQNSFSVPPTNEDHPYDPATTVVNPMFSTNPATTADQCGAAYAIVKRFPLFNIDNTSTWRTYFQPTALSEGDIIDGLISKSTFYKIAEIETLDMASYTSQFENATGIIKKGALSTLKTQEQLPYDDYFSRAKMNPNIIKAYNSRLHLADITRGFFDGFTHFSYTGYSDPVTREYHVHIKTDDGVKVVMASATSKEVADIWFYYPDPRAFRVDIYRTDAGNYGKMSLSMKEHPYLNGAYAFMRLPYIGDAFSGSAVAEIPTVTSGLTEYLSEHLFVSDANNPWVFNASGDHTIRMGGIVGLASQTMALNELEHGIHPLTVFSKRGISLMRLKDDGTYLRSDEISREVCNRPETITETDGPVFFASSKGLMVVAGQKVECVSEQLSGRAEYPFQNDLLSAFIAYDYRDSLLWIFTGSESACWIYNIKSGTFSHYNFDPTGLTYTMVTNVVNDYPDYKLQAGTSIFTLLGRGNINSDDNTYTAQIVTRPLKLENGLALKTIMQMLHVKNLNDDASLTLTIRASDDINLPVAQWPVLNSLRGKPWKYYRFTYNFTNLIATDRFAGTMLITQERRTNKLR